MVRNWMVVFSFVLLLSGCGEGEEAIVCTANIEPGIVVETRDANTDAPLAENAIVVITANDYVETLIVSEFEGPDSSSALAVAGALERPGLYDINLTLAGYDDWSRLNVEITSGTCHVNTVRFTARLESL